MNKQIKKLAADARGQMVVLTTVDDEQWKQHEEFVEKFAQLVVEHVLERLEHEIDHAYEVGDINTAATLQALALNILDDFDMEIGNE